MVTNACRLPDCSGRGIEAAPGSAGEQLRHLLNVVEDTLKNLSDGVYDRDKLKKLICHAQQLDGDAAQILLDAIHLGEDFACAYFAGFLSPPSGWANLDRTVWAQVVKESAPLR